jgi:regulator of ribosome biosynthesis
METMSASDLVDYSVNSAVETVSDENSYDLHNLTAYNNHPIKLSTSNIEELLLKESRKLAQSLVTKIFNCELEQGAAGPVALLPAEIFRIPRAKRIPEPKAQTRWEKFAAEKGIKKKKRDRMVYDDEMDEYRPRYGYKRANGGIENEAIVEIKPGDDPYADPWSASKQEKKERVQKNLKNQTKNLIRAGKDMNGDKMKIFGKNGFMIPMLTAVS